MLPSRPATRRLLLLGLCLATRPVRGESPWDLARGHAEVLRFATLFTAQNVRQYLDDDAGLDAAVTWCRDTGITHVYLETFRGGYLVPWERMARAKRRFLDAGFRVSGCVTTVGIGRESVDGWIFPCFSEPGGMENLKHVFEYTAMQFDEIMIDDFFATRCQCAACVAAKGERSWADFRCDRLLEVSRRYVLDPVRAVNPDCRVILKYPQWYGDFHGKGYDVARQTELFPAIWVGTETRDPNNARWGRHPQTMASFLMRWLGAVGGDKCGGGWFDPYGTSPPTYLEQARQTVLGGAHEALLFCYGALQKDTGPANVAALRRELPGLFRLARLIEGRPLRGIHTPRPPAAEVAGPDRYVYDFLGQLGLPLAPATRLDATAPCAILTEQVLAESAEAVAGITAWRDSGKPALVTDTLLRHLPEGLRRRPGGLHPVTVPADKWAWMDRTPAELDVLRGPLLRPLGVSFSAPSRVGLFLFGTDLAIVENFNDRPIEAHLALRGHAPLEPVLTLGPGSDAVRRNGDALILPARSLVALRAGQP